MAKVIFKQGTQAEYDAALAQGKILPNALYYITDTQRNYLGPKMIAVGKPATGDSIGLLSSEDKTKINSLDDAAYKGVIAPGGSLDSNDIPTGAMVKNYVDTAVEAVAGFEVVIVPSGQDLPIPSEETYHKIYLKESASESNNNYYDEWITIRIGSGTEQDPYVYSWELIGDTSITGDYDDLTNKPQINSVTLSGNKTAHDLDIQGEIKYVTLEHGSGTLTQAQHDTLFAQNGYACIVYQDVNGQSILERSGVNGSVFYWTATEINGNQLLTKQIGVNFTTDAWAYSVKELEEKIDLIEIDTSTLPATLDQTTYNTLFSSKLNKIVDIAEDDHHTRNRVYSYVDDIFDDVAEKTYTRFGCTYSDGAIIKRSIITVDRSNRGCAAPVDYAFSPFLVVQPEWNEEYNYWEITDEDKVEEIRAILSNEVQKTLIFEFLGNFEEFEPSSRETVNRWEPYSENSWYIRTEHNTCELSIETDYEIEVSRIVISKLVSDLPKVFEIVLNKNNWEENEQVVEHDNFFEDGVLYSVEPKTNMDNVIATEAEIEAIEVADGEMTFAYGGTAPSANVTFIVRAERAEIDIHEPEPPQSSSKSIVNTFDSTEEYKLIPSVDMQEVYETLSAGIPVHMMTDVPNMGFETTAIIQSFRYYGNAENYSAAFTTNAMEVSETTGSDQEVNPYW